MTHTQRPRKLAIDKIAIEKLATKTTAVELEGETSPGELLL
jgi:hypothetical protein